MMSVLLPIFWSWQIIMWFWIHPRYPPKITFWNTWPFAAKRESIQRHGFLSITSNKKIQESIEKAIMLTEVVFNSRTLKELQKNTIQSIIHILNHDLVCKHPAAANLWVLLKEICRKLKKNLIRWSFQFVDQILEKTMRCVSLHTKIRRRCKWKNNTRVLLNSEIS